MRDMKCSNLESHVQGSFCFCFEIPTDGGLYWKNVIVYMFFQLYTIRDSVHYAIRSSSRRRQDVTDVTNNVYCLWYYY